MNNLFKEAIADAKAVKDIAQKNAISTLTEAFAPQMQSLLSRRLAEKDEEDMEDDSTVDDTAAPAADAAPAPPAPTADDAPPAPEEDDDDDTDIDEVLAELEGEEDPMDMEDDSMMEAEDEEMPAEEPAADDDDDSIDEILDEVEQELSLEAADCEDDEETKMENVQLKRKLKEAIKVINAQKSVINEVGMLNAKLLYTTKILGKYELTESQKMKILEAFDRVKNLREAKLVFATISESMNKKVAVKKVKRVTEGVASKPIKAATKPINESTEFVDKDRWMQLAGIK